MTYSLHSACASFVFSVSKYCRPKNILMFETHNVSQEQPKEDDSKAKSEEQFFVCPLYLSASLPCSVCQQVMGKIESR